MSEEHFQLVLDSIPGLVFTTRPDGELEWVNRAILTYFDRSLEDLQAWKMTDAVHPDDLPDTLARWQEGAASTEPYELEQRLRRHDGAYRWFHYRATPLRDDTGQLLRWYGLVTDIDDLKRAQEEARLNERHLRLILDNIPGFVYTLDPAGRIEQVNQRILDFFGLSIEEFSHWVCVTHPDDVAPLRARLDHSLRTGDPFEFEFRGLRKDGVYRWFQNRGLPLRDADGRMARWYGLLVDIDDLKRAEEGFRSVDAQLAQASQSTAVSELAASIAHEVNQPLAAVIANGHACHRWLSSDPPNVQRALLSAERTIRDGDSAAQIVSRIRSLFRYAPPVKQLLSLNDVIEEVRQLLVDELRANGVSLKVALQARLPLVAADRVQMQQVVMNLARNGMEAMSAVSDRARELVIGTVAASAEVTVSITDAGEGLEDSAAVFEPFFTTKPHGMGMGLSICKSILDAHGGRLWAQANPAIGTTFSFALPVAETLE